MKVDYQDSPKPKKKRRSRRKKLRAIILACGCLALVLGITVTLMLTVFFNVDRVKVLGSSIYSSEEIIYNSRIFNGDNILRIDSDETEQRLIKSLPYIKEAKVIKSLPYSVGIKVTPAVECYSLECNDGIYIADADYKLLKKTEVTNNTLLRIKGISSTSFKLGETLNFQDKQQRDALNNLLNMCKEKGFNVSFVNVESVINIGFAIENRLYVTLGSYNDMAGKLTHLEEMLKSIDNGITASISLDNWTVENKRSVLKYGNIDEFIK